MREDILVKKVANQKDLQLALEVRHKVFIEEQGIPQELDDDGKDQAAVNLLVFHSGDLAGTGRLVIEGDDGEGHIARIAVLKSFRGFGLSKVILSQLEEEAVQLGLKSVFLYPHEFLEDFYRKRGYEIQDHGRMQVAGYDLIKMRKVLRSS
ncbi:MAG: GNAT family N-acetyltransferase [Bacteroidota bacterium]